jgi:PAS domain S-box-containing protein
MAGPTSSDAPSLVRTAEPSAEPAFAGREQQFRILVESVIDYAIFMLDSHGRIVSWNPGAERIKGYTAQEIIGQHFSTFYTAEDRANGVPDSVLETTREQGRYEKEGWRVRKDGTRFWASVVIDTIRDGNGRIVGFAKVTRDMTERRKSEEALAAAQAALFQAQKMEMVGQLTGGVAHDFNNLLTVIVNALDGLTRPQSDESRKRRLIESAQRAAERGAKLTQQLLAFSRKQPLRPKPNHVNRVIGEFEAVLRRAVGELIELKLELGAGMPGVLVDSGQFEATILNLMVNARDAMPLGGRLRVVTGCENRATDDPATAIPAGRWVTIAVQDEGTGMSEDVRSRAFEPFFTTKEPGKGSGLGLSQVYGFVTQSGGHVQIESRLGQGTRVTLYLPAHGESTSENDIVPRSGIGTVLVVEDDPEVLDAAVDMLRSVGYGVLTAPDALGALDVLRRGQRVDVLFTDIVMPRGVNGVELARAATKLRPGLKVVLASGYPVAALSTDYGLSDEFAFIAKPYRWSEVLDRLRGALQP